MVQILIGQKAPLHLRRLMVPLPYIDALLCFCDNERHIASMAAPQSPRVECLLHWKSLTSPALSLTAWCAVVRRDPWNLYIQKWRGFWPSKQWGKLIRPSENGFPLQSCVTLLGRAENPFSSASPSGPWVSFLLQLEACRVRFCAEATRERPQSLSCSSSVRESLLLPATHQTRGVLKPGASGACGPCHYCGTTKQLPLLSLVWGDEAECWHL